MQITFDFEPFRRHLTKEINTLADQSGMSETDVYDYVIDLETESYNNIKKNILPEVEKALARCKNWHGSKVSASCDAIYNSYFKSYDLEPLSGTSIYLHIGETQNNGILVMKQENGKIEVDDIIEADDDEQEYFANNSEKLDYYALVQSLQSGDVEAPVLTLYTARPTKDRSMYLGATSLPANIFLVNNYNHAMGLASDLSTSDEPRDVYKVRMKNQNLIKTLTGNIEYYQLIKKTPILSIRLI